MATILGGGILISAEQIAQLYHQRRLERSPYFQRMDEVRRHYNGSITVPLPELDELEKPAVANLVAQGIDQFAMRVASVLPDISYPPLRPGIQQSETKARERRLANLGWWDMNKMPSKIRRRARYMTAYGCSPVSISPVSIDQHDGRKIPFWRARNPLASFPAPIMDPDSMEPEDCIFVDRRPLSWLRFNYPEQARVLFTGDAGQDTLFEILEYVSAEETVMVALGSNRKQDDFQQQTQGVAMQILLERIPNRAEICPVVFPGRITLDRLQGQFDTMLGMYQRQAKLDALNTIAVFRSVFPDEWVVGHPNSPGKPRIAQDADGKMGIRGVVENGNIMTVNLTPGSQGEAAMDRLERAQRLTAGIPAEFGGESPTNVRTARRGEMVVGNTIDMPIQEYQEIFAASMEAENRRAVSIMKAYYGERPSMFVMGSNGKVVHNDYVPNESFETDLSYVKYSMPGSDANGLVIALGQRVGTGILSQQTAREMDPAVEDPIRERDQVEIEGLRKAALAGLEQQASAGQLDPQTIARIALKKAERHMTLEKALIEVHQEMQSEQANQANQQQQQQQQPQGPEGMAPQGQEASPEQQPGIGVGPSNAPGTAIPPGPQSESNLSSLLTALRRPTRQTPSERSMS